MAKIIETPTLETKRLILEPMNVGHAEMLEKHFNNWNVVKHLNGSVPWPYPAGGVAEHIKTDAIPRMKNGEGASWAINLKDGNENPIGRIDLFYELTDDRHSHRGFWLAEPYWKQGLMSEGIMAVNDFAFNIAGMKTMRLENFSNNEGSHRVKEKTGAQLVRTEIQKWRGEDREVEIWELTANNWRKFKLQKS